MINDEGLDVINLSSAILTDIHQQVLSIGFSFVPNHDFDLFSTLKDINKFVRGLTIKKHFWSEVSNSGNAVPYTNPCKNEYKNLKIQDQMTLKTLTELQS